MKRSRVIVDAQVSAADVVDGIGEEELRRAAGALAPFTDSFVGADATLAEQAVCGLLGGELKKGDFEAWARPYAKVLSELGLDVDPWLESLVRLRIRNAPEFCRVRDLDYPHRRAWSIAEDDYVSSAPWPDVVDAGSVYTLPVDFTVEFVSNALTALPKATQAGTALRPATGGDPALRALAEHLRSRVEQTFAGARRLVQYAELAPVCAVVATVHAVMRRTARSRCEDRIYRPEVLEACLTALHLGPCREILERILLRDHPEHLHIDTSGLQPAVTRTDWRNALGLFARNNKGELVDVSREARQQLLPRVLFSPSGPEPFCIT